MRLELEKVSLTYQQGTSLESLALQAVDLSVEPGERLGICGATGSGKSTLLAVLAGILEPTSGRVLHDGRKLGGKQGPRPGQVGLGLQTPENCLFEKTVYDDIAFAPRRLGMKGGRLAARVRDSMASVGLDATAYGHRSPFSLSTGEQRRVALAGVIATGPAALLLDEPTAYLDPASRRDLVERLVALNRERRTTLVVVGHDMDEMAAMVHRLVIIDRGRIVADGPASRLLTDAQLLVSNSLEPPATVQLCNLLSECLGRPVPPVLSERAAAELLANIGGSRGMGG